MLITGRPLALDPHSTSLHSKGELCRTARVRRPSPAMCTVTWNRTIIGLPRAAVVVDHFHMAQLANNMLSIVRRRTAAHLRGRRGRATDPEWKASRRLLRDREDLTDDKAGNSTTIAHPGHKLSGIAGAAQTLVISRARWPCHLSRIAIPRAPGATT